MFWDTVWFTNVLICLLFPQTLPSVQRYYYNTQSKVFPTVKNASLSFAIFIIFHIDLLYVLVSVRCVCVCLYLCVLEIMHACFISRVSVCMRTRTKVCVCMSVRIWVYIDACLCVYARAGMFVRLSVTVCLCVCVSVCLVCFSPPSLSLCVCVCLCVCTCIQACLSVWTTHITIAVSFLLYSFNAHSTGVMLSWVWVCRLSTTGDNISGVIPQ